MRPSVLDPLFAPATSLDGIGAKIAGLISRLVPADLNARPLRVGDLPFILPHSVIDRSRRLRIAEASAGIVTLAVTVGAHFPPPRGKRNLPYRVMAFDETGEIALTFFHARQVWLEKLLGEGARVLVSGRVEWFNGRASMVHPDHIVPEDEADQLPVIEPVYPLTAGLSAKVLRKGIAQAMQRMPDLPEWQDAAVQQRLELPSFGQALQRIHDPAAIADLSPEGAPWRRLAYDELLAGQLSLALVRQKTRRLTGRPLAGDGRLIEAVLKALPYRLTASQEIAVAEIHADMAEGDRMLRLLQGDVGSGKTVVALLAMARCRGGGAVRRP